MSTIECRPDGAMSGLSFGQALELMKQGHILRRAGWNGRGMCVFFVEGAIDSDLDDDDIPELISGVPARLFKRGAETVTRMPSISMINADGNIVPGWLASQTDILAADWEVPD